MNPREQYSALKKLVEAEGLLEKQTLFYAYKISLTYLMFGLGLAVLISARGLMFKLADAVFLGIVFAQLAFIVHDAGHSQIGKEWWKNSAVGLISSFLLGGSFFWWRDTHNKHHARPNQISYDPDIDYSIFAFLDGQTHNKKGMKKFIIRNQRFFLIPSMTLQPLSIKVSSLKFLLQKRSIPHLLESIFLLLQVFLYFYVVFSIMGKWQGLIFVVVNQSVYGLCLTLFVAPNHIGMTILSKDSKLDFLSQQVITSRNVKGNPLIDWLSGGLNYQIEHHLFPKMARNNLKRSKIIVEAYVKQSSIPYYEIGFVQAYRDVFRHLNLMSAVLKNKRSRSPNSIDYHESHSIHASVE